MNLWVLAVSLLYLTAAGLLWWRFRSTGAHRLPPVLAWICASLALLLHALSLHNQLFQPHGMVLSLGLALSLFTWQYALLLCLFCLRLPLGHLGIPVFMMAAIGAVTSALIPTGSEAVVTESWTIQTHIVLSLLAYGVLTIASVQVVFLAVQDYRIRNHQSAGIPSSLPPLQTMEQLLFGLIAIGFFLLSLALLSGLLFVENLLAQHLVHKTVLSFCAWIFYAMLLWRRWRYGLRGRAVIRWTLGGYTTLLLAYFGSKYVLEQLIGTHWN